MMLRMGGSSRRRRSHLGIWFANLLVGSGLLTGAGLSTAAHADTLLDALAAAYQYNPRLDAERARLRATDETVAQAHSGYRPTAAFGADIGRQHINTSPDSIGEGTTTPRNYAFQVTQPIFRGFQTTNAVNEAESEVRAGREILRGVEQEVLQSAVQAYCDVVRDQAIVRQLESNLEFLSQELKATKDRFAVGEVTRTDVAQAEARRAQAVSDLEGSRAQLKSSRGIYEQIVGNAPGRLSEPSLRSSLVPRSLDESIGISARENPGVVAAQYREQGARFTVDRIRGELLPSAELVGSYSARLDSNRVSDAQETTSIVGRLNVPIYTGGEVEARVRQAKHIHISRIQEIEQERARAQAAVVSAWAQLQGSRAQLESDKAQIEANRTALNGVREEEKVGQRTLLDVLNARQELLVSEVQLERTKRDVVVATYAVVAAVGRLNVAELGAVSQVYDPVVHTDEVRRKWYGIDITHDDGRHERVDLWNTRVEHEPVK